MTEYLLFFAIVFGVNLLPAFGPPTSLGSRTNCWMI